MARQINLTRYRQGKTLGSGSFGVVYSYEQITVAEYAKIAVKKRPCVSDKENEEIENEIQILSKLDHRNIVRYLGHNKEENHLLIILEYMQGGSIEKRLKKDGPFTEKATRKYTRDILEGLQYLHSQLIIHRDIKGGNVLLDRGDTAKLADFGVSKELSTGTATSGGHTVSGTIQFMAPEVAGSGREEEPYGRKSDIWSVGCVVVQMLTSRPPWDGNSQFQTMLALGSKKQQPKYDLPENTSEKARDFIKRCFTLNPEERPSADQLLDHGFFLTSFRTYIQEGEITIDGEDFNIYLASSVAASKSNRVRREEEAYEADLDIPGLIDDGCTMLMPYIVRMTVLGAIVMPDLQESWRQLQQDVVELIELFRCAHVQYINSYNDAIGVTESLLRLLFEGWEDDAIETSSSLLSETYEEMQNIYEKITEAARRMEKQATTLLEVMPKLVKTTAVLTNAENSILRDGFNTFFLIAMQLGKFCLLCKETGFGAENNAFFEKLKKCQSKPMEHRMKIVRSRLFKNESIRRYVRWVGLRNTFEKSYAAFERTRREVNEILSENRPSVEEARERMSRLHKEEERRK